MKTLLLLIPLLLISTVEGVDSTQLLDEFTPRFDVESIMQALGAPQWLIDNIGTIILVVTILFILSILNGLYRGLRVIFLFLRGIIRGIISIVHFIKHLRGLLNPNRPKKQRQETVFEAMKIAAKRSRHKERVKRKQEKKDAKSKKKEKE